MADEREVLRILELHRRRHGQRGRRFHQGAEGRLALAGGVINHALVDAELGHRNPPLVRRGGEQHGARLGSGIAQLRPGIRHGGTAARSLDLAEDQVGVARGIGGRTLDAHLGPVRIELLGENGGNPCIGALAHFDVLGNDGDAVVGADPDEGIRRKRREAGCAASRLRLSRRRPLESDGERGDRRRARPLQEFAPVGSGG